MIFGEYYGAFKLLNAPVLYSSRQATHEALVTIFKNPTYKEMRELDPNATTNIYRAVMVKNDFYVMRADVAHHGHLIDWLKPPVGSIGLYSDGSGTVEFQEIYGKPLTAEQVKKVERKIKRSAFFNSYNHKNRLFYKGDLAR